MPTATYTSVIPFPVERVWGLMIQPERMAEWNTEIAEVRDITGSMDRVGGGYRQVWRFAGRRMVSKGLWQVTSVEPLRHREFRGLTPMGPMIGRDWFEPIAEGTRLTIQVEYTPPWGPVGRLLDPFMQAMFRRTVARNGGAITALLAEEDRRTP
jgi:Polyketide cyclase / dehydrase and lipid transport